MIHSPAQYQQTVGMRIWKAVDAGDQEKVAILVERASDDDLCYENVREE